MNKARVLVLPLCLSLALTGCASTRVQLTSLPEDARIFVDGEYLGNGNVSLDVGSEYGYPKTYHVKLKREGFETLERTIRNEPDYSRAGTLFAIYVGLGASMFMLGNAQQYELVRNNFWTTGVVYLALSPLFFFTSNKFQKGYEFELEKPSAR